MIETEPEITSGIITCVGSWVHHYNHLLKQESTMRKMRKSPRKRKVHQTISTGKVMLIAFLRTFCARGTTINCEYYCGVLAKLREHVARKRRKSRNRGCSITIMPAHIHHISPELFYNPGKSQCTCTHLTVRTSSPMISGCSLQSKKDFRSQKFDSDADVWHAVTSP